MADTFISNIVDQGGNYAEFASKVIPTMYAPTYDATNIAGSVGYNERFDINPEQLYSEDNNAAPVTLFGDTGLYRIGIKGLTKTETYDDQVYTPIISLTEYKNVKDNTTAWLVLKTYYFMKFYSGNTYKAIKLVFATLTKSYNDAVFLVAHQIGNRLDNGGYWSDYNTYNNKNTVYMKDNTTEYQWNIFNNTVRGTATQNKEQVLHNLISRNTRLLNTQLVINNDGDRIYLAGGGSVDVSFVPQILLNDANYTAVGGEPMAGRIKKVLRTGIDYLHNIDVYDETKAKTRNMMLTNRIGTMPYELVNYSSPNGVIRIKSLVNFTHFVGAGFGNSNMPHIYRVISYKTVGAGIVECTFTLDYLKDYFQHYEFDYAYGMWCDSTTDREYYLDTLTTGDEPYDGYSYLKKVYLSDDMSQAADCFAVTGMISGAAVATYMLTAEQLLTMYNNILGSEKSEKIASQIYRIEYVNYKAYVDGDGNVETLNIAGENVGTGRRILPFNYNNQYVIRFLVFRGVPGVTDFYKDGLEYNAPSVLHIQGYGSVELKPALKKFLQDYHDNKQEISIYLLEDINTGDTTIKIEGQYSGESYLGHEYTDFDFKNNERMPIISDATVQNIRYFGMQAVTGLVSSAVALGAGMGSGVADVKYGGKREMHKHYVDRQRKAAIENSGIAPAGIVASVATGILGTKKILDTVGPTIAQGSGGTIYEGNYVLTYVPHTSNISGYYHVMGYPCNVSVSDMEWKDGHKYTCRLLDAIYGTDEYAAGCAEAINNGYMIYNYSEAAGD